MAVSPTVRINVSGARGRRGEASGPLGAGSVTAETISDLPAEQNAIREKIGAATVAELDAKLREIEGAISDIPNSVIPVLSQLSASDAAQIRRALMAASFEALRSCSLNINGNCRISQANGANEIAGIGSTGGVETFVIDFHKLWVKGSARVKAARVAVNDLPGFEYALQTTVTTAAPSMPAGDFIRHITVGPADRFVALGWGTQKARNVVRYAWVKTSLAGTYGAVLLNGDRNSASLAASFTVDAPNVWQLVKMVFGASLVASNWTNNGVGYRCEITLADNAGPNLAASVNHYFMTTGELFLPLDYDPGLSDTAALMPSLGENLRACQRYYQSSYNLDVPPGTVATAGAPSTITEATASYRTLGNIRFTENMASAPIVTVYSPNTGATGRAYNSNSSADVVLSTQNIGQTGFCAFINNVSVPANNTLSFHYVADARIG